MNTEKRGRRWHRRVDFVYPVDFKILLRGFEKRHFSGIFSSISLNGAAFQFIDKYGMIDRVEILNSRVKLKVAMPKGEEIFIIASIRSVRREDKNNGFSLMFGVEFEGLDEWQEELIESIISLRNRDQKMIWNLWDSYAGKNAK